MVERVDELGVAAEVGVGLEARDADSDGVSRAGGGGAAVDEAGLEQVADHVASRVVVGDVGDGVEAPVGGGASARVSCCWAESHQPSIWCTRGRARR